MSKIQFQLTFHTRPTHISYTSNTRTTPVQTLSGRYVCVIFQWKHSKNHTKTRCRIVKNTLKHTRRQHSHHKFVSTTLYDCCVFMRKHNHHTPRTYPWTFTATHSQHQILDSTFEKYFWIACTNAFESMFFSWVTPSITVFSYVFDWNYLTSFLNLDNFHENLEKTRQHTRKH